MVRIQLHPPYSKAHCPTQGVADSGWKDLLVTGRVDALGLHRCQPTVIAVCFTICPFRIMNNTLVYEAGNSCLIQLGGTKFRIDTANFKLALRGPARWGHDKGSSPGL